MTTVEGRADACLHSSQGVKVWLVDLDRDSLCENTDDVLSGEEQRRANRLATPDLRRRFAAAHAALRRLLAHHTGLTPSALQFGRTAQGKPVLSTGACDSPPGFSLSHSGQYALVGLADTCRIGVDIEQMRSGEDWVGVAEEILADTERRQYDRLSPEAQAGFLMRTWTLKEAFLKALGVGLAIHPQRLACCVRPDGAIAIELDGRPAEGQHVWTWRQPEFAASVVTLAS